MMSRVEMLKTSAATAAMALVLALGGCGGGGSDETVAEGPVPSFAGAYDVKLTKTADNCSLGLANTATAVQSVSQDGRAIALLTNQLSLRGTVDADNAGFSTSVQQTTDGVPVTTTMVYRSTETPGVYGAGFAVSATDQGVTCNVSYNGTAKLRS